MRTDLSYQGQRPEILVGKKKSSHEMMDYDYVRSEIKFAKFDLTFPSSSLLFIYGVFHLLPSYFLLSVSI